MSTFDPSRTPYIHWRCGTLPCTCVRRHAQLTVLTIPCPEPACHAEFFSMTETQEHHLLCHEIPLVFCEEWRAAW